MIFVETTFPRMAQMGPFADRTISNLGESR
jgi:hypothetical protein